MSDIAINPVTRRVQFTGNTGTGPYAFTFNILVDGDIAVFKGTTELTLTTDYTVSINANGTGSITLTAALIASDVLTIIGGRELSRTTDFVTAGDLLASSLNEQLDSNVIMTQQLDEKLGRGLFVNPGDVFTDLELPLKDARKGTVLGFNETTGDPEPGPTLSDVDSLATISADIKTLAEIQDGTVATDAITNVNTIRTDVSTVSGISSNVTTVAGNTSNINAVAGNNANITTVAGINSDVTTVSGISSDVTTVAADGADIGVVAGISSDITTVSGISTEIGRLGTADAVSDMNALSPAAVIADMDSLADNVSAISIVSDDIGYVIAVATNAANINTVAADGADIGTVAGDISNVNTVATNITSVNTNATNITDIQNASANAATATTQAGIATTQAGIATTKASEASASEVAAEAAKVAAEAALDEFTDIYLGAKASDPTTDNDGNALTAGDQYFNTTINVLKIYNGSAWQAAAIDSSGFVETTGDTMTGPLDVQSTITSDGLTVDGDVVLGNGSTLRIDDQDSIVFGTYSGGSSGTLLQGGTSTDYSVRVAGRLRQNISTGGDISFYEDTGTTPKFFWDAAAESLGIGTDSPAAELHVYGSTTVARLEGNSTGVYLNFKDTGGDTVFIGAVGDNAYFETNGSERMRIDSSGQVGIGTSSPTSELHLHVSGASNGAQIKFDSDYGIGYVGQENNTSNNLIIGSSTAGVTFYSSDQERMRIDSSGSVGIGTSSPSAKLSVTGLAMNSASSGVELEGSWPWLKFKDTEANQDSWLQYVDASSFIIKQIDYDDRNSAPSTVGTERMRIDSSGNLLVGKTAIGFSNDGFEARASGQVYITDTSAEPLVLNRKTSDGGILALAKDGTTVGSIGTASNRISLYCTTANSGGIRFSTADGNQPVAVPTDNTGADSDATQDLGLGVVRWKDLYLSGGVVFGDAGGSGTSTSNTLDNYEEGTFTPTAFGNSTAGTTTYASQTGFYTKVGDTVHVDIYISWSAMTGTGDLRIGGLPFTSSSASNYYATGTIVPLLGFTWPSGATQLNPLIGASATEMSIYGSATDSNSDGAATDSEIVALAITMTYKV